VPLILLLFWFSVFGQHIWFSCRPASIEQKLAYFYIRFH
jgi:hypothetical protein